MPQDDRRDEPGRRGARHDPRRPRARDAEQPRARLRLARVGRARDRLWFPDGLVRLRTRRATAALWTAVERRVHRRERGHELGARTRSCWGIWAVDESELERARRRRTGLDVVELGCGTAYFSAWLATARRAPGRRRRHPGAARRGARACSARSGSSSRCIEATRRDGAAAGRLLRPRALRVRRLASGATRTGGSPRRRGCCDPAAGSSSCATRRCSMLCTPTTRSRPDERSRGRSSACIGSSGRDEAASSSTSRTASWIDLLRAQRLRDRATWSSCRRPRARRRRVSISSRRVGAAAGRARRSGSRGSCA